MGNGQSANQNPPTGNSFYKGVLAPYTGAGVDVNTNAPGAAWTEGQHQKQGNVGLSDGSVQGFSISKLREALKNTAAQQNNRLLFP
jgi:hypothetical protein